MSLARAKVLLSSDPAQARDLALAAGPGLEARFVAAAAMRRAGDVAGALRLLAPLAQSTAWGVHYERGAAHAMAAEDTAALDAFNLAHRFNPQSAIAAHALAGQHAVLGQALSPALAQAQQQIVAQGHALAGIDRADPCWLRLLAAASLAQGGQDAAEELLLAALARAPALSAAALDLALLYERQQRGPEALAVAAPLAARHPGNPALHGLVAAAHLHGGDVDAALAALDTALALSPDEAGFWHVRGHALAAAGDVAGAVLAYRRALALRPDQAEPWWSLANLKTFHFAPEDHAAMTAALATPGLPPAQAAHLHFALGRALLDAQELAGAMDHLHRANALRRAQVPFDIAAHEAFVADTMAATPASFFTARATWGDPRPGPVFIVGLPRSGSTLIEQILASHPAVEGLSELADFTLLARQWTTRLIREGRARDRASALAALTAPEARALGEAYLERVARVRQTDRPLFVDKAPGNLFNLALIRVALPQARIIHVSRDPMACGFSLYAQDFADGQGYSYDLVTLGRYCRAAAALAAHMHKGLGQAMTAVAYEELIDDAEGTVRRLLRHCGLPFAPETLRFFDNPRAVRTISAQQVRQPLHRQGLSRWQACAPWLGPLAQALGLADDKIR
ncbi:Flp pilus assembly protein TadD [Novosphingobium capsulatum]|uniref:Flp pilus assembly protein TadD n=1 Tax=Novosphingobium capsulatum TaxID=13688 RepID=A0ABU1MQ71_9SPHN|nr:sulfotransferase [Novosphingobium capsulatum]MDR6512147.1 Flp pilus assembly protein TadD [Novosphingobium capsulatum]